MKINKETYFLNIMKICLAIENKNMLAEIDKVNIKKDKKLLEECIDYVTNVFCKYGLQENDELNDCGYILEETIDFLNNLIYDIEK